MKQFQRRGRGEADGEWGEKYGMTRNGKRGREK